jgi:hypothetical protein
MRLDAARRFALSLPETTEEPHFEKSSFRVRGKIFATVPLGGKHLHVFVEHDERRVLIDDMPEVFEAVGRGKTIAPDWLRVNLAAAAQDHVSELLEEAWRFKAPKRLVAEFDATRGE